MQRELLAEKIAYNYQHLFCDVEIYNLHNVTKNKSLANLLLAFARLVLGQFMKLLKCLTKLMCAEVCTMKFVYPDHFTILVVLENLPNFSRCR